MSDVNTKQDAKIADLAARMDALEAKTEGQWSAETAIPTMVGNDLTAEQAAAEQAADQSAPGVVALKGSMNHARTRSRNWRAARQTARQNRKFLAEYRDQNISGTATIAEVAAEKLSAVGIPAFAGSLHNLVDSPLAMPFVGSRVIRTKGIGRPTPDGQTLSPKDVEATLKTGN